jgi:multicomponent Na+:H+ antiporter subunit F
MTQIVLSLLLVVLVGNVLAVVVRVVLGPTGRDRLLGVVLAGTTGSAVLLVAAVLTDLAALRDTALVVVALATVVVLARVDSERAGRAVPDAGGGRPGQVER